MIQKILVNRWLHFAFLFVLLLAAAIYSHSNAFWRQEMRHMVFDNLNKAHPREKTDQLIILDIDDASLEYIGQWPWPRPVLADIVTSLTEMGAKAIIFDGVLAEPDRTSPDMLAESLPKEEEFSALKGRLLGLENHDEIFAKAIKESGIFVAGFTHASHAQNPRTPRIKNRILVKRSDRETLLKGASRFIVAANFLPVLEKASAGNGSFMATPDNDGVLRRAGLIFSDGKQLYPALSLEGLRIGEGYKKTSFKVGKTPASKRKEVDTDYRIVLQDYVIPIEEDGKILVHYRKFHENGDDYLSAFKAISPEYKDEARKLVKDRYVLVGASAEGLKDLRSTAIEPFQPGVEIHANVLEQILQKKFLLRPHEVEQVEANFILISGLLMIVLAPFVHMVVLGIFCVSLITAAFFGAGWAYVEYGLLLDPFYPSLSVFAVFLTSIMLTFLRVEYERSQVRGAFGLYISPDFIEDLAKNPDKLKLGGEIRDLTILFSDIRSFTTISEGLSPEELIQLMNDFLTPMSDLVMQNKGTIDKYMGDAMMAFWNAPLDDEDHARHACIAALGMQKALQPINQEICRKAAEAGKEAVMLQAGIGINSGPCAVGNMGSKQRFAYSTLGDAVNLASRLEGQTKNYGADILIGESTFKAVRDFAALEYDLIQVKGKTKPEHVFGLLGDDEYAGTPEFQALAEKHAEMIKSYRAQEFDKAKKLITECRDFDDDRLAKLYDVYEERVDEMIANPPGDDWDGVFVATSK